jgi:hypothetical protein
VSTVREAAYDMAAEMAIAAAALVYLTDQPGRWEDFTRFAMAGAAPDAPVHLLTPEGARKAALKLLGLAAAAMQTGDEAGWYE